MPFAIAPTLKRRAIDANIMQNGEKASPQSRHSRRAAMFALSPKADIRLFGRECPLRADTVEKRFCGPECATLIQNRGRVRNFDSNTLLFGFDCCVWADR